jgi:hypothetical protein
VRKRHLKGQVGTLDFPQAQIIVAVKLALTRRAAIAAAGAVFVDIPGIDLDGDVVITGAAVDFFNFGQGQDFDSGIVLDAPEIDLKPAGRRAKMLPLAGVAFSSVMLSLRAD